MKTLNNFLTERKGSIKTFKDIVDLTGSSSNTIEKGSIVLGDSEEGCPFEDEYKEFEKAYKDAGGKIEIEYAKQGAGEIFCHYEGKTEAAKYILSTFCRLIFGYFQF